MRQASKPGSWRILAVQTAWLTALWVVVAFVFGTEVYLTAPGPPVKVFWWVAFASAIHDWFPWILLSPVAVALAHRFRFERNSWRQSLAVHLAACLLFSLAYEGMEVLASRAPRMITTSGEMPGYGIIAAPPGLTTSFDSDGADGRHLRPDLAPARREIVVVNNDHGGDAERQLSLLGTSNSAVLDDHPPAGSAAPTNGFRIYFQTSQFGAGWSHFFLLTLLGTQFTVPIYWCIVCACLVMNHFREAGERERRTLELEARLTQANLQSLKMQLQPHFLFNTLNAIASLIHENPKAADDMIGSLSQFLRTTLDVSSEDEVSLRRELEFVDRYLEIQQTRFGERLRLQREVEAQVLDALVPPLILQPLIENAVRYGIEPRETGGTVTIRAWRAGETLCIEIRDDGEGFSSAQMSGAGLGVGLSNTKARLETFFGARQRFRLARAEPAGALVQVEIPFRLASDLRNKS